MDTMKNLNELALLMEKYGLDEISVEDGGFKAKLCKKAPVVMTAQPAVQAAPVPMVQQINGDVTNAAPAKSGNIVKSPIIGTYYCAAAPGKPAFATVGKKISKGDVICIVESMKLMNEINSEFEGTVAEIYVKDGEAVEFDQPIMRIE